MTSANCEDSIEVVIVTFKRPDNLIRLLTKIDRLWDGPVLLCHDGLEFKSFDEKWKRTREICLEFSLKTNYRVLIQNSNLGSQKNVPSAVSYSLGKFQACIVIEDDLDISDQFFEVMARALKEFNNSEQIMHVAARREIDKQNDNAWNLVDYVPVWGWATWRTSWQSFEDMNSEIPQEQILQFIATRRTYLEQFFWNRELHKQVSSKGVVWDLNWMLNINAMKGKVALSPVNLVQYLGNDSVATNTKGQIRRSLVERKVDEVDINQIDFFNLQELSELEQKELARRMYATSPIRYFEPILELFRIQKYLRIAFLKFFGRYL